MAQTNKTQMLFLFFLSTWIYAQYPAQTKILTYNLWGYRNAELDGGYAAIADVINEIDPDISGHQEVDSANNRSGGVDVIGYLGQQTGMHPYYAPALIGWGGGHYGEGLLSDEPVQQHRNFWVDQPGGEDRSAVEVKVTMGGEPVRILSTHLAHENSGFREYQAEEMALWIDSVDSPNIPMIIMGDFNSTQGSAAMDYYEEIGFVFVSNNSGQAVSRIDHILYRPANRWRVVDWEVTDEYDASDHPAVWAQMELIDPISPVLKHKPQQTARSYLGSSLGLDGVGNKKMLYSINGKKNLGVTTKQKTGIYWIDMR